jgi:phage shock protein A
MVRMIIQEMEETLVEVRSTSARAIADKKELGRRRDWLAAEGGEWQRKAEVAIRKNRDDLARAALVEKNKAHEGVANVEQELRLLDDTLVKLNDDIAALQAKLKDAKARQNSIIMRGKAARSRLGIRRQLSDSNIDDAIYRFEQYERKMDDIEGQIESYDLGKRSLTDEINDLEKGDAIDAELEALKARVSSTSSDRNPV